MSTDTSSTDDGQASGAFWRVALARAHPLDAVLLLALPAVLVAVFALPDPVKREFVFEYTAPTLRTAFVSSYVHLARAHLVLNLVGYALVVPTGYLLSLLSGHRERFLVALVSLSLACPVVLSYLNLTIVRDTASVGFSGVLLAFYGYLPLALADHAETHFDIGPSRALAPAFFLAGTMVIVALTMWSVTLYPITVAVRGQPATVNAVLVATLAGLEVAILLATLLFALSAADGWSEVRRKAGRAVDRPGYFELFVVGGFLFLALPFATFPVDPVFDGAVLNTYVHLLGYALGFIATYATVHVGERYLGGVAWL